MTNTSNAVGLPAPRRIRSMNEAPAAPRQRGYGTPRTGCVGRCHDRCRTRARPMDSAAPRRLQLYGLRALWISMERWRSFGLVTLVSIVFPARAVPGRGIWTCAAASGLRGNAGRAGAARSSWASSAEQVAEAALTYRTFLVSGRRRGPRTPARAGARINETAETLVENFGTEEPADRPGDAEAALPRGRADRHDDVGRDALFVAGTGGRAAARADAEPGNGSGQAVPRDRGRRRALRGGPGARERTRRWEQEVARGQAALRCSGPWSTSWWWSCASLMAIRDLCAVIARGLHEVARRKQRTGGRGRRSRRKNSTRSTAICRHVQEQERSRLARGLHDELGGLLLAARMDLTWLKKHARDGEPGLVAGAPRPRAGRTRPGHRPQASRDRGAATDAAGQHGPGRSHPLATRRDVQARRTAVLTAIFPNDEPEIAPRTAIAPVPGRTGSTGERAEARQCPQRGR